MIQKLRVTDAKPAYYAACPFIGRTINQTPHSSLDERAGAHRARLDGRVNAHSGEPVVAELTGRLAEGDDFRMGRGIAVGASTIAGEGDKFVFADDARPDWHFAARLGFASCGQRLPHPALVQLDLRGGTHGLAFLQTAFKPPNGHYHAASWNASRTHAHTTS